MIKSPLRYPRGKSRAVDLIATLVPQLDEFRDPFLDGGSIFIYLFKATVSVEKIHTGKIVVQ